MYFEMETKRQVTREYFKENVSGQIPKNNRGLPTFVFIYVQTFLQLRTSTVFTMPQQIQWNRAYSLSRFVTTLFYKHNTR
jgi:hypothetical protein